MSVIKSRTVLEVAAPPCVAEDFDGEIVVLNMDTGVYCSFRDLGAALWRDLAAGHPVEELATYMGTSLGSDRAVIELVETIRSQGLMRPAETDTVTASGSEFQTLLSTGARSLTVEVFDDMKSLILLDPVHEADEEKGWPVQRGI